MDGTKVTWFTTRDLMERWRVLTPETVSRRIAQAAALVEESGDDPASVTPTRWGNKKYLRLDQVEAIEAALGVTSLVDHLHGLDAS